MLGFVENEIDHQFDDLAGCEVPPSGLVAEFFEFLNEYLVDVPHLFVRHFVRVEVNFGEVPHDLVEEVCFVETLNLVAEVELFEYLLRVLVVGVDIVLEVLRDLIRVVAERFERALASVVDLLPGDALERGADVLDTLFLKRLVLVQHLVFRRLGHAIETAENRQREDDLLILRLLVVLPKKVRDRPDTVGLLVEIIDYLPIGGK